MKLGQSFHSFLVLSLFVVCYLSYVDDTLRVDLDHRAQAIKRRFLLVVVADVAKSLAPALSEHRQVGSHFFRANTAEAPDRDGRILQQSSGSHLLVFQKLKEPLQDGRDERLNVVTFEREGEGG